MFKKRRMKEAQLTQLANKRRSSAQEVWRNLKRNKGAMIGLVIIVLIIIVAIIAPVFYDYNLDIVKQHPSERLQHPNKNHIFGTDGFGRDIFSRVIYGARYSLAVGVVAVIVALIIGAISGIFAGYYGGKFEEIVMRIADIFGSIPSILMAICISTAFGQSIYVLMLAVGVVCAPAFCRVARAAVLTVGGQEYIEAARAAGARDWQIIFHHVIPNSLAPIVVQATMNVGSAITTASALSFLGLGVPMPAPEWGGMLSDARVYIRDYSYIALYPGLAIMVTVLAINLLGDGLRDAMDPKLKR